MEQLECHDIYPLGMEKGQIPDGNITASSERFSTHHAFQGRLNFKVDGAKVRRGAWTAWKTDVNQWLQVNLGSHITRVTGVATQGREDSDEWVTKYKLQYSNETEQFQYYKEKEQNMVKHY